METVIGVGFNIPSKEQDYIRFDSKGSLSDADVIVFTPDFDRTHSYSLDYSASYRGKPLYNTASSFKIKEEIGHWHNEINIALKHGKTVFILLREKYEFYIHTGQKNTSGTGRNQKVTNIVDLYDNYKFLNPQYKIHNASGSKIYLYSSFIKDLFECCKDYFKFEAHIETGEEIKNPLLATKNKDKILGIYQGSSNGHLIFLPAIEFPDDFFTSGGDYNKKAIEWGLRFKKSLVEIRKSLKKDSEKTPSPEWINSANYQLANSEKIKKVIEEEHKKLEKIKQKIAGLKDVLLEQESLKDLLFETGKPLELAVIKALQILGYTAENYNDGKLELDQIITSPEGDRFIGECEGKDNKDIDISKFRQLSDALNEDLAREDVSDKAFGILFGNSQRLTVPQERTLDFTEKCKRAAAREKIALVNTSELFKVVRYITENEDENYKVICRNAIKDQLGSIVNFPLPHE